MKKSSLEDFEYRDSFLKELEKKPDLKDFSINIHWREWIWI